MPEALATLTKPYVNCLADEYLSRFAHKNATETTCSYCMRASVDPIAVTCEEIAELILDGIKTEWTDPANELRYETAEGGFLFSEFIYDTKELLSEVLEVSDNEEFIDDLTNAFHVSQWCKDDFFGLKPEEDMKLSWDRFCFIVKHKVRHSVLAFGDSFGTDDYDSITRPSQMLAFLSDLFSRYCKLRVMSAGEIIYRVRPCAKDQVYTRATELCPPDGSKSIQSNRMSPAGIPLFYGSFEPITAALETRKDTKTHFYGIAGKWKLRRPLVLLDLTSIPNPPSLYDLERDHEDYSNLSFLRLFAREISQPVKKTDSENTEYVPTQILTEYLRFAYRSEEDRRIDGLIYGSAVHYGYGSCVLFCEKENCVEAGELAKESHEAWLELEYSKPIDLQPGNFNEHF